MRLAILDADRLYDDLREHYHHYGRMFEQLLSKTPLKATITRYSVIDGEYPDQVEDHDAYLITGSKHDSFSDDDWVVRLRGFVQTCYQQQKPLVGICFGHQLLAYCLGGAVGRAPAGWGLGIMTYRVDQQPEFVDSTDDVNLLVSHRDQVLSLPPRAERLLSNDFCPNAAFFVPHRVLALQGHPEFSLDYSKALLDYRAHQFSQEFLDRVRKSYELAPQGERVGRWIQQFLQPSRQPDS